MYQTGDIILYGEHGVCRVAAVGPLKLGGMDGGVYYTLRPYYQPELVIYAPVEHPQVVVRPLLTRAEAEKVIEKLPQIPELEISDEKSRETIYHQIQHGCDCLALAGMIKALYRRRALRQKQGKHAASLDERYFHSAEEQLYGELAYALGMDRKTTPDYIRLRLGQTE